MKFFSKLVSDQQNENVLRFDSLRKIEVLGGVHNQGKERGGDRCKKLEFITTNLILHLLAVLALDKKIGL